MNTNEQSKKGILVAADQLKFKGVPVYMGGRDYVVPSLSVRQFQDHYDKLTEPLGDDQSAATFISSRIPLIGMALRRNYPDITDEQLLDLVDLGTFRILVGAVRAASGLQEVKPGEASPVAAS